MTTIQRVHPAEALKYVKYTYLDPHKERFVAVCKYTICTSIIFPLLGLRVSTAQYCGWLLLQATFVGPIRLLKLAADRQHAELGKRLALDRSYTQLSQLVQHGIKVSETILYYALNHAHGQLRKAQRIYGSARTFQIVCNKTRGILFSHKLRLILETVCKFKANDFHVH